MILKIIVVATDVKYSVFFDSVRLMNLEVKANGGHIFVFVFLYLLMGTNCLFCVCLECF